MSGTEQLTILGCGSAKPTEHTSPASQILQMCGKQFMIDCGEGAQLLIAQMRLRTRHLNHIFLSHLHGDHCFGLIGLISTWAMTARQEPLTIHAQPDIELWLRPMINYFCKDIGFPIIFNHINPYHSEVIYSDRSLTVQTIPLKHTVPCTGFVFREVQRELRIRHEMIEKYNISVPDIRRIKQGEDYMTADGQLIANAQLTAPPSHSLSYAYCSDTAYSEKIIPFVEDVDYLYHEATFTEEYANRCKATGHSTARHAATIAAKAGVKNLIIGHFSSRITDTELLLDEAKQVFPNTILAHNKMTIPLT